MDTKLIIILTGLFFSIIASVLLNFKLKIKKDNEARNAVGLSGKIYLGLALVLLLMFMALNI